MSLDLLYAKRAIFKLIAQFHHAKKFDDGELYIYNYCESALEAAFDVLGIEENYIKLIDFCRLWEENDRAIWAANLPNEPFSGITADVHYQIFEESYELWQRELDNLDKESEPSLQTCSYKELLVVEMKKLGASEQEVNSVPDELIINSVKNGKRPEDVAWAILQ